MRSALIALSAIALACACATAQAATPLHAHPRASQLTITPAPRPIASPAVAPGPSFLGGTVGAIRTGALTLATFEEGDVTVDLTVVRDVWRETSVAPSELEVGDRLMLSGERGAAGFVAWYIWANIGRIDGIVRKIDGDTLDLEPLRPDPSNVRLVMSRYVRSDSLMPTDLRPGDTIGAVVYWPGSGVRRITKMWR